MKRTAEYRFKCAALITALFCSNLYASFEPNPVGARAAGMGEAHSAISDDVYSLYYNPAGILQLQRPELGVYYSQLFVGLTDNSEISRSYFGYAQPLGKGGRHGGIGVSYLALDLPGLYKEESLGISYGREYKRLWNLGGTLKLLRKNIGSDEFTSNAIDPISGESTGSPDPLLASGRSANAIGIDLGVQYRMSRAYALGASMRNLNAPDIGIGNGKDRVPAVFVAALARKLRSGSLDLEFSNWNSYEQNTRFSIGGEHWFANGFALRAGGGFGSRDYSTLSFGASYKMDSIQFDYATVYPLQGVESTMGIQQVSLTVRLGKAPIDPIEEQLIKEKEQRIKAETEARYAKAERDRLKKQLLELTSVKTFAEQEQDKAQAQEALEEAKRQADAQAQSTSKEKQQSDKQVIFNAYTEALSKYNENVRRGIGLKEKKDILEKISADFIGKGINMTTVDRELKSISVSQNKAKKDFDLSMSFYRRLVEQGASIDERKSMLERILQKYRNTGIDIRSASDEMATLQ